MTYFYRFLFIDLWWYLTIVLELRFLPQLFILTCKDVALGLFLDLISTARVVESLIIYHSLSWVNVISIHFLFLIYANEPFRSSIVSIGSKSGTTLNKHMPFKSTGRGRAGTNIFHLLKLFEKDANDIVLTLAFQKCLTSR